MPTYTAGPMPTPDPPSGVNYTPQPSGGTIYSQPNGSELWNTAWNEGYNSANSTSNPYSGQNIGGYDIGQGYTLGQQQYLKDHPAVNNTKKTTKNSPTNTNNNTNTGTTSGTYNFNIADFPNYTGWDPTAAQQDWIAKGRPAPSGSSGSSGSSGPTPEQIEQERIRIEQERIRNQLSSAWDSYFSNLDQQFNGLEEQAGNMNQIVENSYNQGISDINAEQANSLGDLATSSRKNEENQVKSLADIADNIRNLFRSGNIYLGARGAGDSSAANQYSYATAKLGSKQRGSVLEQTRSIENDIEDRRAKLNNLVTQEMSKIKTERDNNVLQTAQWLASAQNELRQMRANGELQKGQSLAQLSQNLLDQARERLIAEDTRAKNRQDALLTWAMNNATTINQLKSNLSQIGQMNVANPTYEKLSGSPTIDAQGNMTTNFYGGAGSTTKEEKPSFFSQLPQNTWLK